MAPELLERLLDPLDACRALCMRAPRCRDPQLVSCCPPTHIHALSPCRFWAPVPQQGSHAWDWRDTARFVAEPNAGWHQLQTLDTRHTIYMHDGSFCAGVAVHARPKAASSRIARKAIWHGVGWSSKRLDASVQSAVMQTAYF